MLTQEQINRLRGRVFGLVGEARSGVVALAGRVDRIWSDTARLTPEARQNDVAAEIAAGRSGVHASLEAARGALGPVRSEVEEMLGRVRSVDPGELARRALILSPIMGAAPSDPSRLVNLYRQRHTLPADRRLIEEAASAEIDARGSSDAYEFRDEWLALERELQTSRGPEELEALSYSDEVDGLSGYLDSVDQVIGVDLVLLDPTFNGERGGLDVSRAMAEAEVNRYEAEHSSARIAS